MHMGEYIEAEIEYMAACLSAKYNVETIYKLWTYHNVENMEHSITWGIFMEKNGYPCDNSNWHDTLKFLSYTYSHERGNQSM